MSWRGDGGVLTGAGPRNGLQTPIVGAHAPVVFNCPPAHQLHHEYGLVFPKVLPSSAPFANSAAP